jgi:Raf kinase inhibitor-like YbhB/YbcL family protein
MKNTFYYILLLFASLCTLSYGDEPTSTLTYEKLNLTSSAFDNKNTIPVKYTCDGLNHSPPLIVQGVSKRAQSLALIAVDRESSNPPDEAIIWFVYNIPANTKTIEHNMLPTPSIEGRNNDGSHAYQSPCPKNGVHHYYFSLYALDTMLPETIVTSRDASSHIEKHLVGYASLMGSYGRK